MAAILVVGVATIDYLFDVMHYPREDEKIRAENFTRSRGGNAANSAVVLSQLGHDVTWTGVNSKCNDGKSIEKDLKKHGVQVLAHYEKGAPPTSFIVNSKRTHSRTIVHHRDLPELRFEEFRKLPLQQFDWIHFEGRNINETKKMMALLKDTHETTGRSVEIEKDRSGVETLISMSKLVFFSRSFAQGRKQKPEQLLQTWHGLLPNGWLTCTWGAQGCYGIDSEGMLRYSAAEKVDVVETVGAGDTFNAAMIHSALKKMTLKEALAFSQSLAAKKIQQKGFSQLSLAD